MIVEVLGFIPVLGNFGPLPKKDLGQHFWPIATITWVTLYLLIAFRLRFFPCPRCGKSYFGSFLALIGGYDSPGHRYSLFSKECANCGLRKDSN